MSTDRSDVERELKELSITTRNWARRIGAYINTDHPDHHGYFTVEEWCEEFEAKPSKWRAVKLMCIRLGEPILFDEFGGHYWGRPGDQAKNVSAMLKRYASGLETLGAYIDAMQASGRWQDCEPVLIEALSASRQNLTMNDMVRMIEGAGVNMDDILALPVEA